MQTYTAVMQDSRSFGALHLAAAFSFNFSVLYLNELIFITIDPFNVCKHRKPRLGARAAWGQKNGAANRPAYCVKEKQTSLIDR